MGLACSIFGHRWRPQASECRTVYAKRDSEVNEMPIGYKTVVLYRCERCTEAKTEKLDGTWTLEQLVLGEEMHDSPAARARTS
jgi:hypothetical protein